MGKQWICVPIYFSTAEWDRSCINIISLIASMPSTGSLERIDIDKPLYDQTTFAGRFQHFFFVTDPRYEKIHPPILINWININEIVLIGLCLLVKMNCTRPRSWFSNTGESDIALFTLDSSSHSKTFARLGKHFMHLFTFITPNVVYPINFIHQVAIREASSLLIKIRSRDFRRRRMI